MSELVITIYTIYELFNLILIKFETYLENMFHALTTRIALYKSEKSEIDITSHLESCLTTLIPIEFHRRLFHTLSRRIELYKSEKSESE